MRRLLFAVMLAALVFVVGGVTVKRGPGGPIQQSMTLHLRDTIGANMECTGGTWLTPNGFLACNAPTYWGANYIPDGETWIFHDISFTATESLAGATDVCSVYFVYSNTTTTADDACTGPGTAACVGRTVIPVAITGAGDPGGDGTVDWLSTLYDKHKKVLPNPAVTGYWQVAVDHRWLCVGGAADVGANCANDSDCDGGVGTCTEEAACSTFTGAYGTVSFSVMK